MNKLKLGNIFFIIFFYCLTNNLQAENPVLSKIVIIGDSISEGYGVDKEKTYASILEKELNQEGFAVKIINSSVTGSTSSSALGRLKWLLKSKPNILILALGGNDGLRGLDLDKLKINLLQTIELALENKIKVLLAGIKIPPNYGQKYFEGFYQVFEQLAQNYNVAFMPFILENVAMDEEKMLPDNIHPNAKGHIKIAENMKPFIIQLLHQNAK